VSAPFDLESSRRREPSINISALIDVIFILMIFVILGANFDRLRSMGIELPQGDARAVAPPETVTVVVPVEGPVRIDGREVPASDVRAVLEARRAEASALVLEADKGLALQRAIDLLDAARAAGFTAVSVATRPRKE
jgi:biopolymer transport protein ExbD